MNVSDQNELVSVLLPVYNEKREYIQASLDSMKSQTYSNIEILVLVDNPLYPDIDYLREEEVKDHRIHVHVNDRNIGLPESLNNGIDIAKGEYICRMDADDISETYRIADQLDYLKSNRLDLVGGLIEVIDEGGNHLYSIDKLPAKPESVAKALKYNNCVMHPTWLGKSKEFASRYRSMPLCEDYDFLIRCQLRGSRIGNLQKTVVRYRMTSKSLTRSNLYRTYLAQKFITKKYEQGECANEDELRIVVDARYDQKKSERFTKANQMFNDGMSLFRGGSRIEGLFKIGQAATMSMDYSDKMWRMMRAQL